MGRGHDSQVPDVPRVAKTIPRFIELFQKTLKSSNSHIDDNDLLQKNKSFKTKSAKGEMPVTKSGGKWIAASKGPFLSGVRHTHNEC